MKELNITGPTVERDDGSVVHPVVYLDESGGVVSKAFVPENGTVIVPDAVVEYEVQEATDADEAIRIMRDLNPQTAAEERPDTPHRKTYRNRVSGLLTRWFP